MKAPLMRWLALAAGLCATANIVAAASQISFTDTWHDTLTGNMNDGYFPSTASTFSVNITLPLNGVDLSKADANTQFSLNIGPAGNTAQIVSNTLGGAENYTAGATHAKFILTDPTSFANIGNVTVSWTATAITIIGSASDPVAEDLLNEELNFSMESEGTNASYTFNSSMANGGFYEVSVTVDASDNGGGTFSYDNPYVLVKGSDKETDPNPDGNGPYPLETGSVTGTGDFTPPVLKITSPPSGFKVYNLDSSIELEGTASDSLGVTDVEYYVNGNSNNPTEIAPFPEHPGDTNLAAWAALVDFSTNGQIGSNVVTVNAIDIAGNESSVSRTFFWLLTNSAVVTVNPANAGKITGIHNGESLLVDNFYTVTAISTNRDWIFSDWTNASGTVLSSEATFAYYDTDGTLTANFVPNPFTNADLVGNYTGLFYDTNFPAERSDAGYIAITVTSNGVYSGKLSVAAFASPFTLVPGQLSEAPDGSIATADFSMKLSSTQNIDVSLQIATDPNLSDPGAGMMSGFVHFLDTQIAAFPGIASEIRGEISHTNAGISNGLYNIIISPPFSDPSQGPGGYSYGSATVKNGAVTLVLNLADGTSTTPISFSTFLAKDGTCPLYASLYKTDGVILGWMRFATNGSGAIFNGSSSILQSNLNWSKMPGAGGDYYTNGFIATPTISGHLYLPPDILWTFGLFATGLPNQTNDPVTFDPANNTFADSSKVTITSTPSTGALIPFLILNRNNELRRNVCLSVQPVVNDTSSLK